MAFLVQIFFNKRYKIVKNESTFQKCVLGYVFICLSAIVYMNSRLYLASKTVRQVRNAGFM